jgi:hypothetical protein
MFNAAQVEQLLRPIHPSRVAKDGKGHQHVPQQDVRAHLIRLFGFGGYDVEVLSSECIFEHNRIVNDKPGNRWDVGYRTLVRLTVRDETGGHVCMYEDGATATAQNQTLGDGHDLAFKSSISLALKRCATNLGDQFGLSLYNKGQMEPLVLGTLVKPEAVDESADDVQEGVPQQEAEDQAVLDEPVRKSLADVVSASAVCDCGHAWSYHGPEPPGCAECSCRVVAPPS